MVLEGRTRGYYPTFSPLYKMRSVLLQGGAKVVLGWCSSERSLLLTPGVAGDGAVWWTCALRLFPQPRFGVRSRAVGYRLERGTP